MVRSCTDWNKFKKSGGVALNTDPISKERVRKALDKTIILQYMLDFVLSDWMLVRFLVQEKGRRRKAKEERCTEVLASPVPTLLRNESAKDSNPDFAFCLIHTCYVAGCWLVLNM